MEKVLWQVEHVKIVCEVSWYYWHFGQIILCCGAVSCIGRCLAASLACPHQKPIAGDGQHTQNIQINKAIGKNGKCAFHLLEKTKRTFWPTQYLFSLPWMWRWMYRNTRPEQERTLCNHERKEQENRTRQPTALKMWPCHPPDSAEVMRCPRSISVCQPYADICFWKLVQWGLQRWIRHTLYSRGHCPVGKRACKQRGTRNQLESPDGTSGFPESL